MRGPDWLTVGFFSVVGPGKLLHGAATAELELKMSQTAQSHNSHLAAAVAANSALSQAVQGAPLHALGLYGHHIWLGNVLDLILNSTLGRRRPTVIDRKPLVRSGQFGPMIGQLGQMRTNQVSWVSSGQVEHNQSSTSGQVRPIMTS